MKCVIMVLKQKFGCNIEFLFNYAWFGITVGYEVIFNCIFFWILHGFSFTLPSLSIILFPSLLVPLSVSSFRHYSFVSLLSTTFLIFLLFLLSISCVCILCMGIVPFLSTSCLHLLSFSFPVQIPRGGLKHVFK